MLSLQEGDTRPRTCRVATTAPQQSSLLSPGDTLGRYELIRQVAVGGMAELYLARTKGIEGFEKLVVVKRILPQFVDNASFVNMFLNEARLAAALHHPNIAQVYDIGVDDGDYFFSMEYVHGEDLGRIITAATENGVPLSLDAALTLAAGLCAGLHHAHDKAHTDGTPLGIVHRDVSPSNVLVSYDGAVKLVDFGIARATGTTKTTTGGLKGKLAFMSPEQCRGQPLDRRSDLYAVGTILYELTTGQQPFAGQTAYNLLNHIVHTDVPAPSTIVADYPEALEAIVMRALARDPAQRFATARELQGALEDFAHESRLRVSPLVLARLMSALFPARLEEWERARAAGAFFVEQHVVRTLIESGKTGDVSPVAAAAAAAAAASALGDAPEIAPEPPEPTSVTQPLDLGGVTSALPAMNGKTLAQVVPFPTTRVGRGPDLDDALIAPPLPAPYQPPPRRLPTPPAGMERVDRPSGSLTTPMYTDEAVEAAHAVSAAELSVGDTTEMVRPLDHILHKRQRAPARRTGLFVALGLGVVTIGVVAAIATAGGGGSRRVPAAPPASSHVLAAPTPTVTPLPPPPEPLPTPPPPPEAAVATPTPTPTPAVKPPVRPTSPPVRPHPRPDPRPARPPKPNDGKDPKWTDDSLYLPVRPDK